MPGGRLTLAERECIAIALADGVGYAEIARQLDRPTSTVSREVGRNGGPGRYRAERAHRTTQLRTRGPRKPQNSPTSTEFGEGSDPLTDLTKELTEVFMHTGIPHMMARILACLYTTDSGSCTAAELVQRLRVSPASVSTSVRYLEEQGLIRRERDSGRRVRYAIGNDVWVRTTVAGIRATDALVATGRRGAALLGPDTPAGERLNEMARFLDFVDQELIAAVARWHSTSAAAASALPTSPSLHAVSCAQRQICTENPRDLPPGAYTQRLCPTTLPS